MENNNYYYNIKAYLEGSLDPKAMHEFEKQALEDRFLADALEGYSHSSSVAGKQLSILQRRLENRIMEQHAEKNSFFFSWQRLSVAAAGGLILILATVLFWMKADRSLPVKEKTMEVAISRADSIAARNIANISDLTTQPQGGWALYEDYLKTNIRVPSGSKRSGDVIVQFAIDKVGQLSNYKIIQSLDEASNKEAIRLIVDGPRWQSLNASSRVQVKVSFP